LYDPLTDVVAEVAVWVVRSRERLFAGVQLATTTTLYDQLIHTAGLDLPDRPDVKIKNHGLGQYGAEPLILRYHFGNYVH